MATYELEYTKCNKPGCKTCKTSEGHGPYWYKYERRKGKLHKTYVGKKREDQEKDEKENLCTSMPTGTE